MPIFALVLMSLHKKQQHKILSMTKTFVLDIKRISFILIALLLSVSAMAQYRSLDQYRFELGVTGGSSFYIGDANPVRPFHRAEVAVGALARYNITPRYTLKAAVTRGKVGGDTRDFNNKYPQDKQLSFHHSFWDMGLNIEFNFMDYGLPPYAHGYRWFSPYIFVGAGLTSFKDEFDNPRMEFNIPWGAGVKFKLWKRYNAGVEWSMHSLFTDDFDSAELSNPYQFKGISSIKNNDKYSVARVFLSIDIFKRKHCRN